jgi:hypothetical protein
MECLLESADLEDWIEGGRIISKLIFLMYLSRSQLDCTDLEEGPYVGFYEMLINIQVPEFNTDII